VRARLAAPHPADDDDIGAWADDAEFAGAALTEAAVLVPIITAQAPGILLTKRTETLRRHAGQVSFPGGRIDPTDSSPEHAALREAAEEIGLDPAHVELLGRLNPYITGTGFRVTPVLGLLAERPNLLNAPAEVADIFELPLTTLLDPNAPERRSAEYRGRLRHYWVWPHPTHYIWGATAAILVHLARRLRG
jgi:8-oxo-dGTP pyrophosphatase MutT (NUDIX family)